jgi:hypothetical protein
MIELQFTKEELDYLHFAVQNCNPEDFLETKYSWEQHNSVSNKIEHEFIAEQMFDLLNQLEVLDYKLYEEWEDKLWYDEQEDEQTTWVKRDPKLWTWETIGELQDIVEQLEAK